ncbi:MAG: CDP-glycerol glycerophosphotransferase family protein [Gammaproteobacteria bacterium]|nr:CDP-glycerol glycerophosphotransferase family protein [Gammaproteobacteria bacterium]
MNISSLPRIVTICGDPGGANAVALVIEFLRAEGKVSVTALAYLQAATLWSERGIQFDTIKGEAADNDILKRLNEPKANLLLTGTSANRFELEKRFIVAARQLGIPSMSVLDFWSNYALRFSDESGNLCYLPDRIAVMDELARDEMVAAGIAGSRIVITGHPTLDGLDVYRQSFSSKRRCALRESLGVAPDDWLVLYASQPPTFSDLDDTTLPPWLDRLRTVNVLLGALAVLAQSRGKCVTLLIRPHPRESGEIYRGLVHETVRIVVSGAGDSRDLALAADAIVGMTTMFLVEARHLGRPTLSIRLDLPLPDDFPPSRSGLIRAVYREEDVASVMDELLNQPVPYLPLSEAQGNASGNVAQLLYSML